MSICHKPRLSLCLEPPSNNNAKWLIKSGAVDPELPGCVVLGIYVFLILILFHFQIPSLRYLILHGKPPMPSCGSSYQSISRLRKHVNAKHTGTLKYRCNTCDQGFAEKKKA